MLFLSSTADDSRQQNRAANNLEVRIATLAPFIAPRRLQLPLVNVLTATTLFTMLSRATMLQKNRSKNTLIKLIDKIFIKLFICSASYLKPQVVNGNPIYQLQKRYRELKPNPLHPLTPLQKTTLVGVFSRLNCLKIPPEEDVTYNGMASAATQRCACAVETRSRCVWSEPHPELIGISTEAPNSQHFGAGQEPSQGQTESKTPQSPSGTLSQ